MTKNPEIDVTAPVSPVQAFSPSARSWTAAYPLLMRSWATTAGQILILTMLVVLSACASNGSGLNVDVPAPVDPAERFRVLAFQLEDGAEIPLTRFESPVRVFGQGAAYGLSDVVVDLSAATGHSIEQVWELSQANIVVTAAPWPRIRAILDRLPDAGKYSDPRWRFECAAFWYQAGGPGIVRSLVFIDADLGEAQIRRCVMQEVAQSLGLHNDIDDPAGTVFSSGSTLDTLSATDRLMLQTLYDPRLQPGMTEDEAMPIVRAILRGGTI